MENYIEKKTFPYIENIAKYGKTQYKFWFHSETPRTKRWIFQPLSWLPEGTPTWPVSLQMAIFDQETDGYSN